MITVIDQTVGGFAFGQEMVFKINPFLFDIPFRYMRIRQYHPLVNIIV
ncbi:hypothetical protein [Tannerella sp.]|nr:hypothetical protein [Tannerella sp.]MDO4704193.1 hypothetical protein [Tannerella sp.]